MIQIQNNCLTHHPGTSYGRSVPPPVGPLDTRTGSDAEPLHNSQSYMAPTVFLVLTLVQNKVLNYYVEEPRMYHAAQMSHLKPFKIIWNILRPFGTILNNLELVSR